MNQRQSNRRANFQLIFAQMPLWEVWGTEIPAPQTYTIQEAQSMYEAGLLSSMDVISDQPAKPTIIRNFKLIPRRLRRSMARARVRREWGAIRGGQR